MNQDAVKRAVQGAARQAFAMGMQARTAPQRDRETAKQQAVTYAEELVLPMVGLALDQAREERWIEDHGNRPVGAGQHAVSVPNMAVASMLLTHARQAQELLFGLGGLSAP